MTDEAILERRRYVLLVILTPIALLGGWALASSQGWIDSIILPSPWVVFVSLIDMAVNGYSGVGLFTHIGISLARVTTAFVGGSILGTLCGVLRGRIRVIDALLLVPAEVLRPIPPLGIIPLFILWFGVGELSKVLLIFLSVFLITMVNAQAGAANCPEDLIRASATLGASRWQTFRFAILPAALPQIMTGLRVAMGTALSVLVASELIGGDRGLGFIVLDASNFFRTSYVFAGVIVIGIIGFVSDRGLAWVSHSLVHWQSKR
jgi:NitT/TauT family transport system permease protein/taurine transport system permease protein